MGMDVSGKAPRRKVGEYFSNSCWWWRPLWGYIEFEAPLLAAKVKYAQSNDGDGLNAKDSVELARILKAAVAEGRTKAYAERYDEARRKIPLEPCEYCEGSGIRKDHFVQGLCNVCSGAGKKMSFDAQYPFDVENVKTFADFLESCGGFEIW